MNVSEKKLIKTLQTFRISPTRIEIIIKILKEKEVSDSRIIRNIKTVFRDF